MSGRDGGMLDSETPGAGAGTGELIKYSECSRKHVVTVVNEHVQHVSSVHY